MKEIRKGKTIEKKSKFFGYLFDVISEDEFRKAIEVIKDKNWKAAHVCYGAIINGEDFFKNDGEVGNPGRILLEILKNNKAQNQALIVARHFGGIKLGPAGVGKAFRECGKKVLTTDRFAD